MNIIFFGSDPWFSQPVLEALLQAGHNIPIVVTKGDTIKNGQRKTKIIKTNVTEDITEEKLAHSLSPYPLSLVPTQPDVVVLAAFGPPFLPNQVLTWPKYGCLNVHASLLPRWRGASPVSAAIAADDQETGVSIMRMTEKIDRGPLLGQAQLTTVYSRWIQ